MSGAKTRIMPRDKGAAPLDLVIAIMAFLAALALGAAFIAGRTAESWHAGLASRITVQLLPPLKSKESLELEIEATLQLLRHTPGIAHARVLSQQETLDLVRPWLGSDSLVAELPLPRLIDAAITPGANVDTDSLRMQIKAVAPDSLLDDHRRWMVRLRSLARGIIWSAYGILALIAVATAATVAFATRAGLDAHREIVALLHTMGARAGFIARAFEWHYFFAALIAGTAGAGCAALLFALTRAFELAGLEPAPLLPSLNLTVSEMALLAAVPLAAGLIALITARVSVLAALRKIY